MNISGFSFNDNYEVKNSLTKRNFEEIQEDQQLLEKINNLEISLDDSNMSIGDLKSFIIKSLKLDEVTRSKILVIFNGARLSDDKLLTSLENLDNLSFHVLTGTSYGKSHSKYINQENDRKERKPKCSARSNPY